MTAMITTTVQTSTATTASGVATTAVPVPPGPLRRLPVPVCEPPYDDELTMPPGPGYVGGEDGTLALAFVLPSGLPAAPVAPLPSVHGRRTGPGAGHGVEDGGEVEDGEDVDFGPQATPRRLLPEPRPWAARLVQAVVEVLAGDRPVTQLVRWTDEDVYATLQRRVQVGATSPTLVGQRRAAGRAAGNARGARAVVRSVHVSEPAEGVAEVCALVQRGVRVTAVALRLDGVDGRWRCSALELG